MKCVVSFARGIALHDYKSFTSSLTYSPVSFRDTTIHTAIVPIAEYLIFIVLQTYTGAVRCTKSNRRQQNYFADVTVNI